LSSQKDNSELFKKVLLRSRFAADVNNVDIYLPACGRGLMFRHVWKRKADYVLALDTSKEKIKDFKYHFPGVDARVADINTFKDWPKHAGFRIADFDVYGSPYRAIIHFLDNAIWKTPLYIFVTDGLPLWLARGGLLPVRVKQSPHACRVPRQKRAILIRSSCHGGKMKLQEKASR